MQSERSKLRNSRWGWLLVSALLVSFLFFLFFVFSIGVLRTRSGTVLPSRASPLIGSWTMSNPQGPGTTRVLTFMRNGHITSMDFSDESGTKLQDISGAWHVEGQTLVYSEHRKGIASLMDYVPGIAPLEVNQLPILSVSKDELLLGNRDAPIRYKRTSTKSPSIAP